MKVIYYSGIFLLLMILSCAQPVTPTGGDKDETAPVIIKTIPEHLSTHNSIKKVSIYFDENITIKSPEKTVIVSPITIEKPRYIKENKALHIVFSAENNTTYSIQLNNTISDLNEGNQGHYPALVFTTGESIDSQQLFGHVEFYTSKAPENIIVQCTHENLTRQRFITKVHEGIFQLTGLDSTAKNILAFDDNNFNQVRDSLEDYGLLLNVEPGNPDSIFIQIYPVEKPVLHVDTSSKQTAVYGWPLSLKNVLLSNIPFSSIVHDTLFIPNNHFPVSTFRQFHHYILSFNKRRYSTQFQNFLFQIPNSDTLQLVSRFSEPIHAVIPEKIYQVIQYDTIPCTSREISYSSTELKVNILSEKTSALIFSDSSIQLKTEFLKPFVFTNITAALPGEITLQNPYEHPLVVNLTGKTYKAGLRLNPLSSETIQVPQGTYQAFCFIDLNDDHLLNPPLNNIQERYFHKPEIIADKKLSNTIILRP